MTDEQPVPTVQRLARRRIAYVSTGALCGMAIGGFVAEIAEPNADLLIALAYVFGAVVGMYFGAQVAPDVFRRRA